MCCFFTKGTDKNPQQEENCTKEVWVYDLRANMPSFGKRTPFNETHLKPFEACYKARDSRLRGNDTVAGGKDGAAGGNPSHQRHSRAGGNPDFDLLDFSWMDESVDKTPENSRLRCFTRDYIRDQKGDSLDIAWLKDENSIDAASLPEPDVLAAEAMGELTEAMRELSALMLALGAEDEVLAQQSVLVEALGLETRG
jgi:type I restriction enzyme M protein